MPKVTIDGRTIEVPDGTNLVRAAELADIEIPHYCYHPGLTVAGNCRMCLVDIRAMSAKQATPLPKLQIACNTVVQDGMVVEASNEKVQQARKAVLEFLLINHPIDCPICDQAGECKLQEYYMDYGRYQSRVQLEQKVHKGKVIPVGADIMLDQERCILCTRCVRFLDEFTETHELTITERGDHCELTLAQGATVDNPYSVNVVDICPVGALTSREFRFQARVWYLDEAKSICAGCATGCNIDVHYRDDEIYRVSVRFDNGSVQSVSVNSITPSNPGGITVNSAGVVSVSNAGPLTIRASWDHLRVDRAMHAAYVVAEWPRLEVPPNWMEPLLLRGIVGVETEQGAVGDRRVVSIVLVDLDVPAVDVDRARRRIERSRHAVARVQAAGPGAKRPARDRKVEGRAGVPVRLDRNFDRSGNGIDRPVQELQDVGLIVRIPGRDVVQVREGS